MEADTIKLIHQLFEKLYELNRQGYYTAWFDWSGHTNGIYMKIIKGKWQKGKKEKIIFEAQICTRFNQWKNGLSDEKFEVADFVALIQSLIEHNPIHNIKNEKYRQEKA